MVISERDAKTSRFETCLLHDVMREVCLLKAKEENFVHIVENSISAATSQSPWKSRRIAVQKLDDKKYLWEWEILNLKLRSFLFIKKQFMSSICMASDMCFTRLQLMRVLDLSYVEFEGRKLPCSIGKLIHLRYLSLFKAMVSHLPSSMRNLKQLLYLNLCVQWDNYLYMPNILKEMGELAYLRFPLQLHYGNTKLELGNLINLETLKNFSTKHSSVKDLQQMTRLETLSILFNGDKECMKTLSSSLSELRHLKNLTIKDDSHKYYEGGFVLECVHLKKLQLKINMPSLFDKQHFPTHLTTISLCKCYLVKDPMPILEKLAMLEKVKLGYHSFSGRRMVCSVGGFPQLRKLEIDEQDYWKKWIVEEGSMPLLHFLDIGSSPKLKQFPASGFPQLHKLKIHGLWEWKEWIVEEGSMPLLNSLDIYFCPNLNKICAAGFPQLQELHIGNLEEWEEWILETGSMPRLHSLRVYDCPKLKPFSAARFPQLHKLHIGNLKEWEEWIFEESSIPLLHSLEIYQCPKLKQFSAAWFPQLHELHTLVIIQCPKLKELPDGLQFMYSLKYLRMPSEWKKRLSEGGEDYYKVKHIPCVEFDNDE